MTVALRYKKRSKKGKIQVPVAVRVSKTSVLKLPKELMIAGANMFLGRFRLILGATGIISTIAHEFHLAESTENLLLR